MFIRFQNSESISGQWVDTSQFFSSCNPLTSDKVTSFRFLELNFSVQWKVLIIMEWANHSELNNYWSLFHFAKHKSYLKIFGNIVVRKTLTFCDQLNDNSVQRLLMIKYLLCETPVYIWDIYAKCFIFHFFSELKLNDYKTRSPKTHDRCQ